MSADDWLKQVKSEGKYSGKLKVFFGYAAGVGKTYAMLEEAHDQIKLGRKVVVGYVEPHTRPETTKLLDGLNLLPKKKYDYKGIQLEDFDLDGALMCHPDLILVDELAHTNPETARNKKRYQDIEELLKAGIDVYTTMNVQHIESLNDVVEEMTGIEVKETVPDIFFSESSLKVIDIAAEELLERLRLGKIYKKENTDRALQNFFIPEKLNLLRGLAIQKAADHITINENKELSKLTTIDGKFLSLILGDEVALTKRTLRWTARLSQLLRVHWIALNIKTEDSEDDHPELVKLAEKLGAEVITIESYDLVETMVSFIKLQGITDLVLGKKVSQPWWKKIFRTPIEDKLFDELNQTEIHLLPYDEKELRYQNDWLAISKKLAGKFRFRDLTITLVLLAITTAISLTLFGSGFGDQNIIILYLLMVISISRITRGYLWSTLSSIFSVVFFNWFFVYPYHSLTVLKEGYPFTLVFMLVVGLIVSNIMVRMKASAISATRKERQIQMLYDLNRKYLVTNHLLEVLQITATYLSDNLKRDVFIYNHDFEDIMKSLATPKEQSVYLENKEEAAIAHWSFINQKEAGRGTDTLSGAKGRYFPVTLKGETVAVIGVGTSADRELLSEDNLSFIRLVVVQMAIAIEQKMLQQEKEFIHTEKEKEKTKGNLLRAVSHDLRTPLTGISGSVELILNDDEKKKLSQDEKRKLLVGVKKDSEWLLRMIENLLSITRIDTQKMAVATSEEVLDDILSAAIQRIKKYYPTIELDVSLPAELILVQVDPILMEQVIFNLLENSVRYRQEGTKIYLNVEKVKNNVRIHVINEGKESDVEYLNKLFENNDHDSVVDSKKGLGIGLSIVKTIVSAHSGEIYAKLKKGSLIDVTVEIKEGTGV